MNKLKTVIFCVSALSVLTSFLPAGGFTGDGKDEIIVFRPGSGLWAIRGVTRFYFGAAGDYPVLLSYNSSSASDPAIFRPNKGLWAVRGTTRFYYGNSEDIPVIGDYNRDGRDEIGIFRGSSGLWAIRGVTRTYFGARGDIPVPGDYDGDGFSEAAIFRKATGLWAIHRVTRAYYGGKNDLTVPGDYQGNGTTAIGVFRGASGLWAIRGVTRRYYGRLGDIPQPFRNNATDLETMGIFRPENGLWAIRGVTRAYFGGLGDIPMAYPRYWTVPVLYPFGIEVTSENYDLEHLEKVNQAGAGATRFGFISWRRIDPWNLGPEFYNWDIYDQRMAEYAEMNLNTIVTISDIPSWAGQTRSGPFEDDARDDFAEFITRVVNRYSCPPYNIKFWELFNEPDGTVPYFGASVTSWGKFGKEYALMLKEVYPAIKAADPESRVIIGGLAYDNFIENGGCFYRRFLNDVLANGGGKYFDIMNFHYYYFAREDWGGSIIGKINSLKDVLAGYGVNKPTICTEVGIWGYEEDYYLDLQARYVPMVYCRGLSAGLGSILWFPLASEVGGAFEGGLLREEDLSAKPAYISYQVLTSELKDYKFKSTIDTGDENLEGYEFTARRNGKSKYVFWAAESYSGYQGFSFECIRIVSIEGDVEYITDGAAGDLDGKNNGQIWIAITPSPVFLESW